jgi:glycosyltransferase involved in cell wall biosynthesis
MTTAGAPAISVVIATLNRAELLAATLESLDDQTTAPDHEIIVVDHGSTDPTAKVCLPRARAGRLRYRRIARVGTALAKNAGLLAARAPLVLFLDDDLAAPDLLVQHVHSHEAHPEEPVAVQGLTTWAPGITVTPLMEHLNSFGDELLPEGSGDGAEPEFSRLRGGQWSCKRQFLLDYGAFDPAFTSILEEVELAYRLAPYGFRVIENPRAVTYVAAGVTLANLSARADRRRRALALLARPHDNPDVAHS